ncbi:MAG: ribonuclease H-like domain-containing protein [Deltaproteobacteria bacterium]|nr:ribonuclease H-like domain-containing protein [Deltaproteobacteria bacterium]
MLPWSLSGAPGVGASRERALWNTGAWDRAKLPEALGQVGVKGPRAAAVVAHVERWDALVAARDACALHAMLPTRERWRVLPLVLEGAAFVDIETDGRDTPEGITAVCLRSRDRASCWLRATGRDPDWSILEGASALVSFNGLAFDVPMLVKAWPAIPVPQIHLDLVAVARRMRWLGGLKAIERMAGWQRAPHVENLRGGDAIALWSLWLQAGDRAVLQRLCEYNMEDVWSLPFLAAWAHDHLAARTLGSVPGAPKPAPLRTSWLERDQGGPLMLAAVADALHAVPVQL